MNHFKPLQLLVYSMGYICKILRKYIWPIVCNSLFHYLYRRLEQPELSVIGQALPSSSSTDSTKPKTTIDPSPKQKRSTPQIKRPEKSKLNLIKKAKLFQQDKLKSWYILKTALEYLVYWFCECSPLLGPFSENPIIFDWSHFKLQSKVWRSRMKVPLGFASLHVFTYARYCSQHLDD